MPNWNACRLWYHHYCDHRRTWTSFVDYVIRKMDSRKIAYNLLKSNQVFLLKVLKNLKSKSSYYQRKHFEFIYVYVDFWFDFIIGNLDRGRSHEQFGTSKLKFDLSIFYSYHCYTYLWCDDNKRVKTISTNTINRDNSIWWYVLNIIYIWS